jgi:ornithine cyclodeaminase/alanine dehydrogenase-like protein (mu-crystallin family)
VLSYEAVISAVSPQEAIAVTRAAFARHQVGEWAMPPKLYLNSRPYGDFRAMPALGEGLAILKWVTSFPGNRGSQYPTVTGIVCVSDARTGELLMLMDAQAVTALRTGAAAAVAAIALGPAGRDVGIIGCGIHGAWVARCLHVAGFGPGVCTDPDAEASEALAGELGWSAGTKDDALASSVVCCITPGGAPVVNEASLHPAMHLNMLGADGPGKAEATVEAVVRCRLFCDEWAQASHGGELTGAIEAGAIGRTDVTELGAVLVGQAEGRRDLEEITMFDSTGLAIQDLGIASAALRAWRAGNVVAQRVNL